MPDKAEFTAEQYRCLLEVVQNATVTVYDGRKGSATAKRAATFRKLEQWGYLQSVSIFGGNIYALTSKGNHRMMGNLKLTPPPEGVVEAYKASAEGRQRTYHCEVCGETTHQPDQVYDHTTGKVVCHQCFNNANPAK